MIDRIRHLTGPVTLVAGLASITVTSVIRLSGRYPDELGGRWTLAEVTVLLLLIAATVRLAPVGWAVAATSAAGTAASIWLLRFGALDDPWILFAPVVLVPIATGLYLRGLDARRSRAVTEARRTQRLKLARDLHDFVAHDISEMLAQAQAGQIIAADDPDRIPEILARIEHAGLAAMESMDRTVRMLRDDDEDDAPGTAPAPSLGDLPELAERFEAAGPAVHLDLDPGIPRDPGSTIYRIVTEALTNVRRHAPTATKVDIQVHNSGPEIIATITDDGRLPHPAPSPASAADRGGHGLAGLAARAEAAGGTLTAGPADPHGWTVTAVLPVGSRSET